MKKNLTALFCSVIFMLAVYSPAQAQTARRTNIQNDWDGNPNGITGVRFENPELYAGADYSSPSETGSLAIVSNQVYEVHISVNPSGPGTSNLIFDFGDGSELRTLFVFDLTSSDSFVLEIFALAGVEVTFDDISVVNGSTPINLTDLFASGDSGSGYDAWIIGEIDPTLSLDISGKLKVVGNPLPSAGVIFQGIPFTAAPIPEPSTFALGFAGAVLLLAFQRLRRRP